jgi:aspartate racemase
MKRIGLLGGMSWESSIESYRFVKQEVRDRLGGASRAPEPGDGFEGQS